jgi:phosphatidylinositol 3-kinase
MESSTAQHESELTYVRHCEVPLPLSIKLSSLQGSLPSHSLSALLDNPQLKHTGSQQSLPPDLYLIIQLWSDNNQLIPPIQSAHKSFKSSTNYQWNQQIQLPIKYRDLPRDAQLTFTVYDIASPRSVSIIGGSTLRLFGKKATLKKGKQRLFLWKGVKADGGADSETPSKVGLRDEMGRLEKEVKRHERGDVTRLDWLDKLAFRQIERIHAVGFSLLALGERGR